MSSPSPVVSVIIPARNEEDYIRIAIGSAIHQTYAGSVECVVVDNGSSDGTTSIAEAVPSSAERQIIVVQEPSLGVGRAKNTGAIKASGAILIFLDADSTMALDLGACVATRHAGGELCGSIRVVAGDGSFVDRAFFEVMELGKRWFGVRAQMLYCDRELFELMGGFDPELRLGEDVEFLKRANRKLTAVGGKPVCHVSESEIRTSARRLAADHHFGMVRMFARWAMAFVGIGRRASY